jgi:hypothetical protein
MMPLPIDTTGPVPVLTEDHLPRALQFTVPVYEVGFNNHRTHVALVIPEADEENPEPVSLDTTLGVLANV